MNKNETITKLITLGIDSKKAMNGDLKGINLVGVNLRGADLRETDLRGSTLTRITLAEANLTRANLGGTILDRANLAGADLKEVNLIGANLIGTDLRGVKNIAWNQDIIAEILRQKSKGNIRIELFACYLLIRRDLCPDDYIKVLNKEFYDIKKEVLKILCTDPAWKFKEVYKKTNVALDKNEELILMKEGVMNKKEATPYPNDIEALLSAIGEFKKEIIKEERDSFIRVQELLSLIDNNIARIEKLQNSNEYTLAPLDIGGINKGIRRVINRIAVSGIEGIEAAVPGDIGPFTIFVSHYFNDGTQTTKVIQKNGVGLLEFDSINKAKKWIKEQNGKDFYILHRESVRPNYKIIQI